MSIMLSVAEGEKLEWVVKCAWEKKRKEKKRRENNQLCQSGCLGLRGFASKQL